MKLNPISRSDRRPPTPTIDPTLIDALWPELIARGWRGSPADAARALGLRPVPMPTSRLIDGDRS